MLRFVQKCFPLAPVRRAGSVAGRVARRSAVGVGAAAPRVVRRVASAGAVVKAGGLVCIMVPLLLAAPGAAPGDGDDFLMEQGQPGEGWVPPYALDTLSMQGFGGSGTFGAGFGIPGGVGGRAPHGPGGRGEVPSGASSGPRRGVGGADLPAAAGASVVAQNEPIPVPEPASLGVFAIGLLGMVAMRRRRREAR